MLNLFDTIFRLLIAFCLGSIIGFEREKKASSAGLRTHILVCTGSTLIMLVSLHIFEIYQGQTAIDPGRIAAGVVTGIGFLGAGTIIRSREGVKGLTTAASIWISSAIGLAVGCGYISAALMATLISYLSLSFLKKLEN
ncbi:MAG: MgtC/SapB family protein [Candidatus Omnitrophica bacterium]|nr:MgtC/SapB family protein [Candidatus Omnitrophota bacterium]